MIDVCFCDFLKKVMGLHRSTRNRKVIMMSGLPLLTEHLINTKRVPGTDAYEEYIDLCYNKFTDIEPEFFSSPVMKNDDWKGACYEKRHLLCRHGSHGFHHKYCSINSCHERNESCICIFCKNSCFSLLHSLSCSYLKDKGLKFLDSLEDR